MLFLLGQLQHGSPLNSRMSENRVNERQRIEKIHSEKAATLQYSRKSVVLVKVVKILTVVVHSAASLFLADLSLIAPSSPWQLRPDG